MTSEYIEELQQLLIDDQQDIVSARSDLITNEHWLANVASRTNRVKQIIEKEGITANRIGDIEGYKAMLVLVLHSGNRDLLEQYLSLHATADTNSIIPSDRAFVIDKLELLKNGKQLYGTQFRIENGQAMPLSIENETDVDIRRLELGMGSLTDYLSSVEVRKD